MAPLGQNKGDHGGNAEGETQKDNIDEAAKRELKEGGKPVLPIDLPDGDQQLDQDREAEKGADERGERRGAFQVRRNPIPMMTTVLRKTKACV